MFKDYLKRQMSHRNNVFKKCGMSEATYYRRLNNPKTITLGEFQLMIKVGELDEKQVIDYLFGRSK